MRRAYEDEQLKILHVERELNDTKTMLQQAQRALKSSLLGGSVPSADKSVPGGLFTSSIPAIMTTTLSASSIFVCLLNNKILAHFL